MRGTGVVVGTDDVDGVELGADVVDGVELGADVVVIVVSTGSVVEPLKKLVIVEMIEVVVLS